MKKKKGFTLIELLAVIVILAIIALIAVPIILNIIERARKGAAQDSANGLRKAAQLYYSSSLIDNFNGENIIFECNGQKCEASNGDVLEIDGTIPTNGRVEIKANGKMTFSDIVISGYSCEIPESGNSVCTKNNSESTDDSAITLGEIEVTVNSIVIPYTLNGETSTDVALNDTLNNTTLLAYNDSKLENKEILLLNDNEANVTCEYGTSESYGESGILQNNSCYITGLDANTTYYYKLTVTDSNGDVHTKKGSVGTSAYVPGEVVYFNPFTGEACYNYAYNNSNLGYIGQASKDSQNECLKWSIISYNNSENKLDIILDHNITSTGLSWDEISSSNYFSGVSNLWTGATNIRHITADEIANITGASSENTIKWSSVKTLKLLQDTTVDINVDLDNEVSWFYFDGKGSSYNKSANGWQLATAKTPGSSKYAWLYDNTSNCVSNGCNYEEGTTSSVLGYWTSTQINTTDGSQRMWAVKNDGSLSVAENSITSAVIGVRPIITVDKNSLLVKKISDDSTDSKLDYPELTIDNVAKTTDTITISFDVNSDIQISNMVCEYGLDDTYGNYGVIEGNSCVIDNLQSDQTYYYNITVTDILGRYNMKGGSISTTSLTPLCKRATYLHEENCVDGGCNYYFGQESGTKISYGNLGMQGKLNSGDAFTCDVNGDDVYDEETERFYYVSDYYRKFDYYYDYDDTIAVLIYYSNTAIDTDGNVIPNNTYENQIPYHSGNVNNLGPVDAAINLPTTEDWPNVNLINDQRQILNYGGETTTSAGDIVTFDYSEYSARFLTDQELFKACGEAGYSNNLTGCEFLVENTWYTSGNFSEGYWLETPHRESTSVVFSVVGDYRDVGNRDAFSDRNYGVRPVIEVLKTNIEY